MWSTNYIRYLGIQKCWAWIFISARLILCLSRQAICDSEDNQFLLSSTGFMNECLNTQPLLISASVIVKYNNLCLPPAIL